MASDKNHKYAVYEGRQPGLYDSYSEAKAQVHGYPGNCYEKVQPTGEPYSKPYVVYDGNNTGVYGYWRDTHAQVTGYSGARFEKTSTFSEAEAKFKGSSSSKKRYY